MIAPRSALVLSGLGTLALAAGTAALAQTVVIAPSAPPPPQVEAIPPPPAAVDEWQPGHWNWSGSAWEWVPGQYVQRPQSSATWVPGQWQPDTERGGYVWVPGHWSG